MQQGAVAHRSRIPALLLKCCNLVELGCSIGTKATAALVEQVEQANDRSGSPRKQAVTATLLRWSISTSSVAQFVSEELVSLIWWPRMGVELYEAHQIDLRQRHLRGLPGTVNKPACCETQIRFVIGPPGPEQWVFFVDMQQLFKLDMFSIQRRRFCDLQLRGNMQQRLGKPRARIMVHVQACSMALRCLLVHVISESKHQVAILTVNTIVCLQNTIPCGIYLPYQTGAYNTWTAVVTGTRLGLLQLDCVLQGVVRTLEPHIWSRQPSSAVEPVLACFQAKDRLQRTVQRLLISRQAAARRTQYSMQKAKKSHTRELQRMAMKLQRAEAERDNALQEQARLRSQAEALRESSQAVEQLAAHKLAAEQQSARLQLSLRQAQESATGALQSMDQAVAEAAAAKKKTQTAEAYTVKLKAMLEKHLRSDMTARLEQLKRDKGAAKAEAAAARAQVLAVRSEADAAKAELAAAHTQAAAQAASLQSQADAASHESASLRAEVTRLREQNQTLRQQGAEVQTSRSQAQDDAASALQDRTRSEDEQQVECMARQAEKPSASANTGAVIMMPSTPTPPVLPTCLWDQGTESDSSGAQRSPGSSSDSQEQVEQLRELVQQLKQQLHKSQRQVEESQQQLDEQDLKHSMPIYEMDDGCVIGEELGAGANCVVYAATNSFWPGAVLKEGPWHSIHQEAQQIWEVHHPNMVRVFGVLNVPTADTAGQRLAYLAMERLGPTLDSLLTSNKQFDTREVVVLLQQVAAALSRMHHKRLVHQDLHAGNVLLTLDGTACKVADLGSAQYSVINDCPNCFGVSMCTTGLESPQLATDMLLDGQYQPLASSDMWALGQLGLLLTGGKQPDEHQRLQNTFEYKEELRLGTHDLTHTPGHKACAEYLMSLSCDDDAVNYGDQVSFEPSGNGRKDHALAELQAVIRGCLHSYTAQRLRACDVQEKLFRLMVRQGWTNQLNAGKKQKKKRK